MNAKISFFLSTLLLGGVMTLSASSIKTVDIPVKRIALFSSGVGFFEHEGSVNGDVKITLPFEANALNDVLKSLLIYDEKTSSPLVSYPSEMTLSKTLSSLKINLSNDPSMNQILNSLKGAEVEISTPQILIGRIIGAKSKFIKSGDSYVEDGAYLSIFTNNKIQVIDTKEILSYNFVDEKISKDLNRALDLLLSQRDDTTRNIDITLPSTSKRDIAFSYVIESPVWKASYRLDLSQNKPMLQGWAIVDNVGNIDWNNIELSLVTGKPVSFVQDLYAPYHIVRPNIPLSIASYATAKTYDDGYVTKEEAVYAQSQQYDEVQYLPSAQVSYKKSSTQGISAASTPYETAQGKSAGDMFSFTIKKPITLARQQSAMLPLVNAPLNVKKISIFQGRNLVSGGNSNPSLGAVIVNNSGMSLPAGPISIYDDGIYAGDALIEFLNENGKRIISFGDDLAVVGTYDYSHKASVDSVVINKGLMKINQKTVYTKDYLFKNSANVEKNIVLEHPINSGSTLITPLKYSEKTGSSYRFEFLLPAKKDLAYKVSEEVIHQNTILLLSLDFSQLVYYSKNDDIPKKVQDVISKAVSLKSNVDKITFEIKGNNEAIKEVSNEQERIRKNIVTVGNDSSQGKDYIKKLTSLDNEIETLTQKNVVATKDLKKAQEAFNAYVSSISI